MESKAAPHWPALRRSLSDRCTRCIHPNCAVRQSDEQHSNWGLYGRYNGRRFAVCVPEDRVPEVHQGVENGCALQDLLIEAGLRYVKALKRARMSSSRREKK